jgi:hypothetical protein
VELCKVSSAFSTAVIRVQFPRRFPVKLAAVFFLLKLRKSGRLEYSLIIRTGRLIDG